MKREGALSGVADLILLYPSKGYHALCIEMKAPKGVQSKEQKAFQSYCTQNAYQYHLCYSLEQFIKIVNDYLR
jgi:hypothetical protein